MASGTSHRSPGALPPQASGFVGRQAELAGLSALLDDARLVTVTGTGGVGKTRLALRAAAQSADRYPDGVDVVELSAVRDPGLLAHTVAARLGLPGEDTRPQLEAVLDYLRGRELLLILDTCEHLIDACATFADAVLREAPDVTILATSRQPLDVGGENTFLLSPLPVPQADDPATDSDAVELFAQRAAAIIDGFTVAEKNRADVIRLCRALDGIPLAIELATVRLRALPLDQMAKRVDDHFRVLSNDRLRVLTGGKRAAVERHQTLHAAIEWSYELCTQPEQLLWARLSVFAGRFDLAAAAEVCADDELNRDEIIETLVGLVEKSVLVRDDAAAAHSMRHADAGQAPAQAPGPAGAMTGSTTMYLMLDTIREFGAERLADGNTETVVRNRFIAHYLAMAERFGRDPMHNQLSQYRELSREHANLRAAIEYALDLSGNDNAAVTMATSLFLYWRMSGRLREGEYWLDRAAERCARPSVWRARVLGVRGYVRESLGDRQAAREDAEAAVAMATAFGDMAACGRGYVALHRTLTWSGSLAEADMVRAAAMTCLTSVGDMLGSALVDVFTVMLHLQAGEPGLAIEQTVESLSRLPADEWWVTSHLLGLQSTGLLLRGDFGQANVAGRRALSVVHELGDVTGIAYMLGVNAFVAGGQHRYERAAWLLGASAPLWERVGNWYTGAPALVALHRMTERAAQDSLGEERYWQLRELGSTTPLDQVVALAVTDADQLTPPTATAGTAGTGTTAGTRTGTVAAAALTASPPANRTPKAHPDELSPSVHG